MPANLEERLRLARPNAGGPTLEATAIVRERALAALPTRSRRKRTLAAAVAIAAAIAAVLAVELRSGAGVASAAQVRAAVSQTLASASNLSGVLVIDEPTADGSTKAQRRSFALNSAGDLRLTGLDTPDDLAFDGDTDTLKFSQGRWFAMITGFPPPTNELEVDWMLEREIGSVITALAAERDTEVQNAEYDGRPAWLLTIRTADQAGGTLEREITVDRALGLPVHDVLRNGDRILGEWRLENLSVDGDLPPSAFSLEPRPDQKVHTESLGSRRIALGEIEATAGYALLVPSWLPSGFRLDHAALSPSYTAPSETAPMAPKADDVAAFVYRRGLEQITVTMRPRYEAGPLFLRPVLGRFCIQRSISAMVCANSSESPHTHVVTLTDGALAGRVAKVTIDVVAPPTLTAETSKLDVQISGDADEAELTRIADSLAK